MPIVPMVRTLAVVALLLPIAGMAVHGQSSPVAPSDPPANAERGELSGRVAWEKLQGNTLVGTVDGKPFAEFYGRDGVVKFRIDGKVTVGRWQLDQDLVCFEYPGDPRECLRLTLIDGSTVVWTDHKGVIDTRGTMKPGNDQNL